MREKTQGNKKARRDLKESQENRGMGSMKSLMIERIHIQMWLLLKNNFDMKINYDIMHSVFECEY